ncbi:MAG: sigma-70 family RNA polymerase sigma factor [Planctomycetota bacterium]|nr:MAG: sigma-70 family RNA polymerase sigma factor [Planctomycetota bacterium]
MREDVLEHFVRELTGHQNRLYGYIYSLVGDHDRAADVLQETNLALWRRAAEYDPARPFLPWAFGVARMQVLAHLRDRRRDRLLLDAELAELLAEDVQRESAKLDRIQAALRECLGKLSEANRELVERRYFRSEPLEQIAQRAGRTLSAIKVALLRVRRQLGECVQRRLSADA